MKSVGSYNDWGYYAPPPSYNNWGYSSELPSDSAYASSVPPIHYGYTYGFYSNPGGELNSSTQVLDSSSSQFPHSEDSFSYDPFSNAAKLSLAEAPPYYPSCVSSTIHDPISHWSSSSGFPSLVGDYAKNESPELGFPGQSAALWNHCAEFNLGNGKLEGAASSFSSLQANVSGSVVEESINQECHDGKDSEVSQTNNSEKYNAHIIKDPIDDSSCWWGTFKPMQSSPMSLEDRQKAFLKTVADTGNHHLLGTFVKQSPPASLEDHKASLKSFADSGNHYSSGTSDMKSSPMSPEKDFVFSGTSVKQSPPISPEDHHKDHYKAALKLFADSGNHHSSGTSVKQSPPITPEDRHRDHIKATFKLFAESGNHHSSGTSVKHATPISPEDRHLAALKFCQDSSNHHLSRASSYDKHSRIDEPSSSKNGMIANKNVTRDVVNYVFNAGLGFQSPHASLDNLSLKVSANEDPNSIENSFEGGNRRNPAVDSPCWKGAPAASFSKHVSSDPLPTSYVHNNEECFGSIVQEPQNLLDTENVQNKSCEDSKSYEIHSETVPHETNSAGSSSKFSVPKFAPADCKSDGAVNAGPFLSDLGFGKRLQVLGDIMKENGVPPTKPVDCKSGSFHTERQVLGENQLISQKQHSSSLGSADSGCNVNNCLDICQKSAGKVSNQALDVQMLVGTVQNLSELLLYHCLHNAYELEERDSNILKSVINNLNACVSKNDEQTAPAQECLSHQPESSNSSCAGDLRGLQLNASSKRSLLTKNGLESSKVDLENSLAKEANLHVMSGKPHLKISDSIFPNGDTEMMKADNMTKALKKILSENFHDDEGADAQTLLYKNLWLEAEAAICSVNYRARYNQMKIEMEKQSDKQRDLEEQPKSEAVPTLSKSQSPAAEASNHPKLGVWNAVWIPNLNSPAQDLPVMSATNLNKASDLKFSTDMNKPNTLTPEGKSSENLESFIQNYYTASGINKEAGNDDASVMARYRVLKARLDENLEVPSDTANKLAPGGSDNQNQVSFCQDSPIPGKNKADYETSVVTRFHILKSRIEDSSSIYSEGKLLDGDESDDAKDASDGESLDFLVNPAVVDLNSDINSYTAVDKPISKDFYLDLEDSHEVHPTAFQLRTCHSDGLASDWEHVE